MTHALSYVHGACATPLTSDTIGGTLDRMARHHGSRDAVVAWHEGTRLTYDALRREADQVARGLIALDVTPGARVGLWSANCAEWLIAQYAAAKIGAVLVHLNPASHARELEHALNDAGVSVLIMAATSLTTNHVGVLAGVRTETVHTRVCLTNETIPEGLTWTALRAKGADVPEDVLRRREAAVQCGDAASIMYTSGTTGQAKGVVLSHHSLLNSGFFIGERQEFSARDRLCLPVPLYHTFGYMIGALAALTHGSAVVLPGTVFDPVTCLQSIEAEGCTAFYGVPSMFAAVLRHPAFAAARLTSLRTGVMAGAPCPVDLMRAVVGTIHMPEVTICYGQTEAGTVCQSVPGDSLERRVTTVGAVHPHLECKVVDPDSGRTLPREMAGELWVRGYSVMTGYWQDEMATRAVMPGQGWLRTGDRGVMHHDGYLHIVGRLTDMVISAGRNVSPREIEEVLRTHPKIREAAVVGIPDPIYGEVPCAWIQPNDGAVVTTEEVRRFCRTRLASYKVPRRVRITDRFPMTASGKVQKYRLRELSIDAFGLSDLARVKTA